MYFPKDSCLGATESGCSDGKGNYPGMGTCGACPSCSRTWTMQCQNYGGPQFKIGDIVDLSSYGKFQLMNVSGATRMRPAKSTKDCYLDHIYAISSSDGELHYKDAKGDEC